MKTIVFSQVKTLVSETANEVIYRFFDTLEQYIPALEARDWIEYFNEIAERIAESVAVNHMDVHDLPTAEKRIEQIYNDCRTEFTRLMGLAGGTVEFGPDDVQPLTDQRIGQSEAWERWYETLDDETRELRAGVMIEEDLGVAFVHCMIPASVIDDAAMDGYTDQDRYNLLMETADHPLTRLADNEDIAKAIKHEDAECAFGFTYSHNHFRAFTFPKALLDKQ